MMLGMKKTPTKQTVILTAGGTGGHIFPAAALAEVLLARGYNVRLATDKRFHGYNHAGNVLTQIPIDTFSAGNLSGNPVKKLIGLLKLMLGTVQAMFLLRRCKPIAIVGFGGYPSLPTMLAGIITGKRTIIHEQNSVLGRVNRLIAQKVSVIATTYADTLKMPTSTRRVVHTGNPVRASHRILSHRRLSAIGKRRVATCASAGR